MEDSGSEWLVFPADTSSPCTQLGDQEDGVVLCGGGSTSGPVMSREWLGWGGFSLLSFPGEDNDAHGG